MRFGIGSNDNVAPVKGVRENERLMYSNIAGKNLNLNILVKGEWDAAEDWMNNEEQSGRMSP